MAFREPFHFFIRETTGETTGDDPSVLYDDDDIYRKTTLLSSHRSTYCLPEGRQSSPRIWHAAPPERQGSFPDEPIGANARLEVAHSRGPPPVPTERERLIARNSAWTPPRVPRARAARRTAARAPVRDPSRASVPEGRVRASTPREAPGHLACSTSHAV